MQILILTNKLPYPPKDGGAIATLNLALGLNRLDNRIDLLVINTSKHYFPINEIPESISLQLNINDIYIDTNLNIRKGLLNFLFSKKPYNAVRFESLAFDKKLKELLIENDYDIVQLEGLYLVPYIKTIREYSKAGISMRSHNVEHEIWERNAVLEKNVLKRMYLNILARRIKRMEIDTLNDFDYLLPITDRDAEKFDELGCKIPKHVVNAGINMQDYAQSNVRIEFPSLFHIGALDWAPNQEGLIWFFNEVWPELRSNFPKLLFYLAGRNAPQIFEKQIKNIDGIVYIGEVESARDFILSKAIMIVPIFAGSGMRIKIIEGLAYEKAIVSTSIGIEGIPVTDGENILIANNKDTFISRITEILNDRIFFDKISNNAGKFARENFDTFTISENLLQFYKSHL